MWGWDAFVLVGFNLSVLSEPPVVIMAHQNHYSSYQFCTQRVFGGVYCERQAEFLLGVENVPCTPCSRSMFPRSHLVSNSSLILSCGHR